MNRFNYSVISAGGFFIALLGSVSCFSAGRDDAQAGVKLRGEISVDDSQSDSTPSGIKSPEEGSRDEASERRAYKGDRKSSLRSRGRDDQGILTRDEDYRYDDRARKRHR